MSTIQTLEWLGALLGLLGAGLLAANTNFSGWGFLAFLLSNACWIAFGLLTHAYGLIAMQIGFSVTSVVGLFRWLLIPPLPNGKRK